MSRSQAWKLVTEKVQELGTDYNDENGLPRWYVEEHGDSFRILFVDNPDAPILTFPFEDDSIEIYFKQHPLGE